MQKREVLEKIQEAFAISFDDIEVKDIPSELRSFFRDDCLRYNRLPAFIMLGMSFVMESMMLFFYLAEKYVFRQELFFPQYIYLYTSMIIISLLFISLLVKFKEPSTILMFLELAVVSVLGIWSAVFSAIDVINGFSSYLFIQIMIINSLAFKIKPFVHCMINVISFVVYMLIVVFANLSYILTFAELINPFLMLIAACVMIALNDKIRLKSYMDKFVLKEQCLKLEFYANNDFLTRIGNRKSIIEHLDMMLSKKQKNITCIMIDIDDFKIYNDTYGHVMGDNCLIKLTNIIEKCVLGQNGKVGRYGGEEFLVLFEGKTEQEIISIADELLNRVRQENLEFYLKGEMKIVTISMGICFAEKTDDWNRRLFLECADRALYRAKKEGKNQFSIYKKLKEKIS
ncbi:MAG: diguanylate cyclase [Clostridia bacterium]|jgi:diguanylate cyclase (GGDEF)-like protein|nr:diguanylate cyclase [Clostridia bacterium]